MLIQKKYVYLALILLVLPVMIVVFKSQFYQNSVYDILPKNVFKVAYEFDMFNLPDIASVKAYVPETNGRQIIRTLTVDRDSNKFRTIKNQYGKQAEWKIINQYDALFSYEFEVESKSISFELPEYTPFEKDFADSLSVYLNPSEYIQSKEDSIQLLAKELKSYNLYFTLRRNFDFVGAIERSNTSVLTDAVTTLKRNRGSCNGKSRLFVALCRAQGIPARVAGGIILENTQKRTSHLWAEVSYQGHWIPFDIINNHFAELPAHYLELYKGDDFLISRTSDIEFYYQFRIKESFQSIASSERKNASLWSLIDFGGIPIDLLRGILLLPLAALIVAIFRNIIGLKTFGIFLPALIGLALVKISFIWGLVAFFAVILVVSILHFPLEKLGLLHTPKLVIMLTCVVLTLLGLSIFGLKNNLESLSTAMFLPVIVLAITAERFAKILVEDNFNDAIQMLASTFFIAFLCYPIFSADLLLGVFLTYPELYFSILGIMILLGRWIGLRVMEYFRFSDFSKYKLNKVV
ncbi:hypothetical protein OAF63_00795 [Saprospiraceae bacterium]|nr:hypothetical protein [Bacteroidota bacterium]MDB4727300.1 hypothetical protein [Saprospiraceae bacterium]